MGNEALYDLCRDHPGHTTAEEIVAKVWLIGRSYAASIERRRPDGITSEAFYSEVVVQAVLGSSLDEDLARIAPERQCEGHKDARLLLATHAKLMDIFREASGRSNRSLASKYLHFHRPLFFPIFDSRADRAIRHTVSGRVPGSFPKGDREYRTYVARFILLRQWIASEYALDLTPRQVDRILLNY